MLLIITVIILLTYTVVLLMFFMGWCALLPKIAHPRPEVVPFSVVKSPRRNSVFISFESITSTSMQSLDYIHHKLSLNSSSTNQSAKQQKTSQQQQNLEEVIVENVTRESSETCANDAQMEKKSRSTSTPDSSVSAQPFTAVTRLGGDEPDPTSASTSNGILKGVAAPSDYLHPKYSLPPIKIDIADHLLADQHLLRTPVRLKCGPMKVRSRSFDDRDDAAAAAPPPAVREGAGGGRPSSQWQEYMPLANLRRLAATPHRGLQHPSKSSSTCLLSEKRQYQSKSSYRSEPPQQHQSLLANTAKKSISAADGSFIV